MLCTPPSFSAWCSAPPQHRGTAPSASHPPALSPSLTAVFCKAVSTPVASLPFFPPALQPTANWPPTAPLPGLQPPSYSFGGSRSGFPLGSAARMECLPLPLWKLWPPEPTQLLRARSPTHALLFAVSGIFLFVHSPSALPVPPSLPGLSLALTAPDFLGGSALPGCPWQLGSCTAEQGTGCRVLTPAWNPALCLPGPAALTNSLTSLCLSFLVYTSD